MTFYTVLKLLDKYRMNPEQTIVTVSRTAASINGTSANLKEGDQFPVSELIYGLMLPSGNDAAYALAEHFGHKLATTKSHKINISEMTQQAIVRMFIREMNKNAHKLKMNSTQFDSPHGLMNKNNFSTAKDILLMSLACMKIPRFRKVVNTKYYCTRAYNNQKSLYNWENTNKLLGRKEHQLHWIGCKTGVTDSAGPCFSGFYENNDTGDKYCVIVLSCKTMESRWVEVPKMVKWAIECK